MNAPQDMPEGKDEGGADYDALRCELLGVLMERRSQGRFDGASGQALCLARSIADVLRFLTYADGYGQFGLGRERFQELDGAHAGVKCGACPSCTVQCPYGVNVTGRLIRAQELFAC